MIGSKSIAAEFRQLGRYVKKGEFIGAICEHSEYFWRTNDRVKRSKLRASALSSVVSVGSKPVVRFFSSLQPYCRQFGGFKPCKMGHPPRTEKERICLKEVWSVC